MDTFVGVIFNDESAAYKGADALRDLHKKGDLIVYSAAVIGKDADGKVSLKSGVDEGPIGTAFGLLTGAMVGLMAGPIAVASGAAAAGTAAAGAAAMSGAAVGSATGGMFGMFRDLYEAGIDADVLDRINNELAPGKTIVVASVDEIWTAPLDMKMKELGGTVHRKARIDIVDEQIEREIELEAAELEALEKELQEADAAAQAAIKEKIAATKKSISETNERTMKRLVEIDKEFEARQKAMDDRVTDAIGSAKEKREARKAKLKAEYEVRSAKLKKAAKLAGDALS